MRAPCVNLSCVCVCMCVWPFRSPLITTRTATITKRMSVAPIILVPSCLGEGVCFVSDFNYLQLISRPIKTCGASNMRVIKKISALAINARLAFAIMAIGCDWCIPAKKQMNSDETSIFGKCCWYIRKAKSICERIPADYTRDRHAHKCGLSPRDGKHVGSVLDSEFAIEILHFYWFHSKILKSSTIF